MAVYDHEEQEQLDELKAWWRQNGKQVLSITLVIVVVICANFAWKSWQNKRSAEASVLYGQLQDAASKLDVKRARDISGELVDKYAATSYASLGALIAAKVQVDGGDAKNAKAQLAWVADNGNDAALRDLARLRLAGLLLDEKSYDDALAQLAKDPLPSFAPRFGELKGDILAAQGKKDDARTAYQFAIAKLDEAHKDVQSGKETPLEQRETAYRELVKVKLDSLGEKS